MSAMPTIDQIRHRAAACHEWVRRQEGPTRTVLGWRKNGNVYTVSRAGWDFIIRSPRPDYALMTGTHADGRSVQSTYGSVRDAKGAAFDAMHPAEQLGLVRVSSFKRVAGGAAFHYGLSGVFSFVALELPDGSRHLSVFDDQGRAVAEATGLNLGDVRDRLVRFLTRVYGQPVAVPERADMAPVDRLVTALLAAGVDVTPDVLAAALDTCGMSLTV